MVLAASQKGMGLPVQLSDFLKMAVKGQTKVNLEITGAEEPLSKIDGMVNKLVMALICTGSLVGASLLCTADLPAKLLGIPALGIVGFLMAAVLGTALLYSIHHNKR